jgi:hypothetical protein
LLAIRFLVIVTIINELRKRVKQEQDNRVVVAGIALHFCIVVRLVGLIWLLQIRLSTAESLARKLLAKAPFSLSLSLWAKHPN